MFEGLKRTVKQGKDNLKEALSKPAVKIKIPEGLIFGKNGPQEPADFALYKKGKLEDPLPENPKTEQNIEVEQTPTSSKTSILRLENADFQKIKGDPDTTKEENRETTDDGQSSNTRAQEYFKAEREQGDRWETEAKKTKAGEPVPVKPVDDFDARARAYINAENDQRQTLDAQTQKVRSAEQEKTRQALEKEAAEKTASDRRAQEYFKAEKIQGDKWSDYSLTTKVLDRVNSFTGGKLDLPSFIKMDDQEYQKVIATLNPEQVKEIEEIMAGKKVAVENTEREITPPIPTSQKWLGRFNKLSEKAKSFVKGFYEGLYKIPGVKRIVGKLEIAYNQMGIDDLTEAAEGLKDKVDSLDTKDEVLVSAKKELEDQIASMEAENLPGVEKLKIKLQVLDLKIKENLKKREKKNTALEAKNAKSLEYAKRRDAVADRLIKGYEERLQPLEKQLEQLETQKNEAELIIAATEIKHEQELERLAQTEEKKEQMEEKLRAIGMSERKIRKFAGIKILEEKLREGRERIEREQEELAERKARLEMKIMNVDAKAEIYRGKKEEFVRVKEGRPKEVKPEKQPASTTEGGALDATYDAGGVEDMEDGKMSILKIIRSCNESLKRKYKGIDARELIDEKEFVRLTKFSIGARVEPKKLKALIEKYYKVKKLPLDKFTQTIARKTIFR